MTTQKSELLTAIADMTGEAQALRKEVIELKSYGKKSRRLIRIVAVSVVFDILVSVGLFFGYRRTQELSSQASSAVVATCLSGNESRRIQTDLWHTLLSLPPSPGQTPEQKKYLEEQTAKFKSYIDTAFKQRDCSKS